MTLKCIGSGSSGNSYALIDNDNKILLLDLGLPVMEIKKAIDFRISDVVGAVVTHQHQDHSKSVADFGKMGIPVFKPYEDKKPMTLGGFKVCAIAMTDLQGKWMNTNADGSECPCYGFLIEHNKLGRMLYITDRELVKWRFKDIIHMLICGNYISDNLDY